MERAKNKRILGKQFEDLAVSYLIQKGYEILERNYRYRGGEIDIIASYKGTVIAIEVKYRSSLKFGLPSMAVNIQKQRKISRTFVHYLCYHNYSFENPYRFDVLSILAEDDINHIENAFEYIE